MKKPVALPEGSRDTRAVTTLSSRAEHLHHLAEHLLHDMIADAQHPYGGGSISASAYETAWVALLRDPQHPKRLAFPQTLRWLRDNQHADGSWGPPYPFSVVPSLAALLALCDAPQQSPGLSQQIQRAVTYLRQVAPSWDVERCDTPFVEFLIPHLHAALQAQHSAIPFVGIEAMQSRARAKLTKMPLSRIYDGSSSAIHALEALGMQLDYQRLRARQMPGGGYGYSPSATASVLLHAPEWDDQAANWLHQLTRRSLQGAVPTSFPADIFEIAWVTSFLLDGNFALTTRWPDASRQIQDLLATGLSPSGASFGRVIALPPDVDDTAMVLAVLRRLGRSTPLDALERFAGDDHYLTFVDERTSSTSANAHALEALTTAASASVADQQAMVICYLLDQRQRDGCWHDKWSISPFYATLSCVMALTRNGDPAVLAQLKPTLDWVRDHQQLDGAFGAPSIEETAYGLLTLKALSGLITPEQIAAYQRAIHLSQDYLWNHLEELEMPASLPALWVDKDLYCPHRIVKAAVLGALHRPIQLHHPIP